MPDPDMSTGRSRLHQQGLNEGRDPDTGIARHVPLTLPSMEESHRRDTERQNAHRALERALTDWIDGPASDGTLAAQAVDLAVSLRVRLRKMQEQIVSRWD